MGKVGGLLVAALRKRRPDLAVTLSASFWLLGRLHKASRRREVVVMNEALKVGEQLVISHRPRRRS